MWSFILSFFVVCAGINNAYAKDVYESALMLTPDLKNGKHSYRLCASCHLENGLGKSNGSFPVIASQHRSVIIKQLKDIQKKYRQNPTMYPFSDPQTIGGVQAIADVAAYIESMPSDKNNGVGSGDNLVSGKELYLNNCIACHGNSGQGDGEKVFPRIKDQHYEYILRQLKWIRDGYRTNSNPGMLALIKNMSDQDLVNLADYVSRF